MNAWPFDLWLRYAVLRLGLSPDAFWAMSVADFLALMRTTQTTPMNRADLGQLMNIYPDTP